MNRDTTSAVSRLTRVDRFALLTLVAVICLPHALHLPAWVSLATAALLLWNAFDLWLRRPPPAGLIRGLLTGLIVAVVVLGYGRIDGRDAGVALLTLMLALKLSETVRRRDAVIVLALCCFVLITQFLFSQSLAMAVYLLIGCWLVIAGLVRVHASTATPLAAAGAESARLLMLAVPVAAIMFVLFPRLPGPLWGMGASDQPRARTGLSDHMAPGSIAHLARSDAVAFRVRFAGDAPRPAARYWRGPVLWDFNRGTWFDDDSNHRRLAPARVAPVGAITTTDITLAPSHEHWLITLDAPIGIDHAHRRTPGGDFVAPQRIDRRIRYVARSATRYRIDRQLSPAARQRALALPAGGNPKARALAQRWAAHDHSSRAIIKAALTMFRQRHFVYTLNPPPTSQADSIDDFLFATRAGFCEHFAGAFTFLMRAAGVPARVVTGYQGAQPASVGDYWIVRDSDAHAWSEVWIAGQGWVRVDPTAAAAPSRIENGIGAAVSDAGDLPFMARAGHTGGALWYHARMLWDAVDAGWNRWFLAYGPSLQQRLFAALGIAGIGTAIAWLTGGIVALLGLVSLGMAWRMRPVRRRDPVERAWQGICRRLARQNLPRATGEAPNDYAARVAAHRPDLTPAIRDLAERLTRLRYGARPPEDDERREFIARARRFSADRRRGPRATSTAS